VVHQLRVGFEGETECLDADEFALPVEVGRDDELVGLFGQRAYRFGNTLLGDVLLDLRVYEAGGLDLLPVGVLFRVLRVQDVALETDRYTLLAIPGEGVVRHRPVLTILDRSFGEELGYLFCRIRFFRDY